MFRVTVGLVSAFRSLGAILLIGGLGMMFAQPAVADDGQGGASNIAPFNCHNCLQWPVTPCFHANGCYCFEGGSCKPFSGLPECLCQP